MWSADDVEFKLKVYLLVCWDFCLSLKIKIKINNKKKKKEEEEKEEDEDKKDNSRQSVHSLE